jgi:hypothetical protein
LNPPRSDFTKRFIKGDDLVTRRIAGETIIVPVKAHVAELDSVYRLNELGSLIWERVDGRSRMSEIADAICIEYDVTPEAAVNDVAEFLGSLEAAGLIRASEEGET